MAKTADVVNEIIRFLQDRQRSRMPTFNRDDPNGSVERLFGYLQEQGDERAPDEQATEDAPQARAAGASGILAIGGRLSGFQTPNGWLLSVDEPPEKPGLLPLPERFLWGKVASEVGSGVYTFDEQALTDGTTWANKSGGLTGETCYESNDVAGIAVGTIIKIRIEYDTTGTLRYVFNASSAIPPGTADHDILVWDQTTDKAWEVRAFAGSADWDILVWDQTTDKTWEVLAKADADYKVLQRKSDDSIGWDWVRAH